MREIRFRAWDGQDKIMRDVEHIWFNKNEEIDIKINNQWFATGPGLILMQFTGLKDKNRVEIYEGDLVFHEEGEFSYQGVVKKDKYYFYIDGADDSYSFEDVSDTFHKKADLEIIGNIYKNTELLATKKD